VGSDVIGRSEAADFVGFTVAGVTLSRAQYCRLGSNATVRWSVDSASEFLIRLFILYHYNTLSFVYNVHFIMILLVIRDIFITKSGKMSFQLWLSSNTYS
jgi:hypothetical protein